MITYDAIVIGLGVMGSALLRHFLVDRLPGLEQVLLVSSCSGHSFKFAPAIGEVAADLLTDGIDAFDISPFALSRFEKA